MVEGIESNPATTPSTSTPDLRTAEASTLPEDAALQCCFNYFFKYHFASEFCSFFYKPEFQERHREHPFLVGSIIALTSRYLTSVQAETYFNMTPDEVGIFYGRKMRQMARDTSDNPTGMFVSKNGFVP